jgi:GNAT superfamily N-acetyltransferase
MKRMRAKACECRVHEHTHEQRLATSTVVRQPKSFRSLSGYRPAEGFAEVLPLPVGICSGPARKGRLTFAGSQGFPDPVQVPERKRPRAGATIGSMWALREAEPGADDQVVTALMVDYLTWAHRELLLRYGIDDPPADPALVADSLAGYRRPDAAILLAERDGVAIGVGAIRRHGAEVAEVKRMYVVPAARRHHAGSAILDRLIEEAAAMDARTLRLDTCRFMTGAQRLYQSRGFLERGPIRRPRSRRGSSATGGSSSGGSVTAARFEDEP